MTQMVKEFDVDGDGFIDFKEFVEVNTQGVDADEEVMENLKDAFDVDRSTYIWCNQGVERGSFGDAGVIRGGLGVVDLEKLTLIIFWNTNLR